MAFLSDFVLGLHLFEVNSILTFTLYFLRFELEGVPHAPQNLFEVHRFSVFLIDYLKVGLH